MMKKYFVLRKYSRNYIKIAERIFLIFYFKTLKFKPSKLLKRGLRQVKIKETRDD